MMRELTRQGNDERHVQLARGRCRRLVRGEANHVRPIAVSGRLVYPFYEAPGIEQASETDARQIPYPEKRPPPFLIPSRSMAGTESEIPRSRDDGAAAITAAVALA